LVEPETRDDPQSLLLWTCKSLRKLSQSLRDMGHAIGRTAIEAVSSPSVVTRVT
jgi:hypothetical protein